MELHGLKLDHLVIGNPLFKERILVNEGVRFFSGLNSSDDDTAGSWHAGSGNEQFFCAIPLVEKFAVSRYDAFDLFNGNFVFEKEKEHIGSKLTEGVGLTSGSVGTSSCSSVGIKKSMTGKNRTIRSLSLPVGARPYRYQENIPRPATGSGFIAAGAVWIFWRKANSSWRALSY
jgi:hypothetical protein